MPPQRPLPRPVPLFHNETLESFLNRLAAANHLPTDQLLPLLGIRTTKKTPASTHLEALAAAADVDPATLRLALPEFLANDATVTPGALGRPRTDIFRTIAIQRLACRRCTQAAGIPLPVTCWMTHERNICLRHRLWIGDSVNDTDEQADISKLQQTLHAQNTTGT